MQEMIAGSIKLRIGCPRQGRPRHFVNLGIVGTVRFAPHRAFEIGNLVENCVYGGLVRLGVAPMYKNLKRAHPKRERAAVVEEGGIDNGGKLARAMFAMLSERNRARSSHVGFGLK